MSHITIKVGPAIKQKKCLSSAFVSFDYNPQILAKVKTVPNYKAYYHPDSKTWEISSSALPALIQHLSGYEIRMQGPAYTEADTQTQLHMKSTSKVEFKLKPFDHQVVGVDFGLEHAKFLLADDQGLGKTMQALTVAVARKKLFKHCLIVCGVNSVKRNWLEEIAIHTNEEGLILGSRYGIRNPDKLYDDGTMQDRLDDLNSDLDEFFLITNIETFRYVPKSKSLKSLSAQQRVQRAILERVEHLTQSGEIGMVIFDEAHKAKNPTSSQGKAIHQLDAPFKMALTGTPVMNRPLDVYNILKWLGVEHHSYTQFSDHFTIKGGFSEITGYKNLGELKTQLDGVMLRRTKDEVLDLPPKIRQRVNVQMTGQQLKIYEGIRDELIRQIDDIVLHPNPLSMLTRLRQVTSCPQLLSEDFKGNVKFDAMHDIIESAVESDQKVAIFSNWSAVTSRALDELTKYNPAYIDGGVTDRMAQVHKFQDDPSCKVIIGTIGAMGTGLTLTAGTNVIFLDKPWNPALVGQAEDRCYRIGTQGTVNVYTIVAEDSVDDRIESLIMEKQQYVDILVESNYADVPNTRNLIEGLLS